MKNYRWWRQWKSIKQRNITNIHHRILLYVLWIICILLYCWIRQPSFRSILKHPTLNNEQSFYIYIFPKQSNDTSKSHTTIKAPKKEDENRISPSTINQHHTFSFIFFYLCLFFAFLENFLLLIILLQFKYCMNHCFMVLYVVTMLLQSKFKIFWQRKRTNSQKCLTNFDPGLGKERKLEIKINFTHAQLQW